jgi:hypothetical protein
MTAVGALNVASALRDHTIVNLILRTTIRAYQPHVTCNLALFFLLTGRTDHPTALVCEAKPGKSNLCNPEIETIHTVGQNGSEEREAGR